MLPTCNNVFEPENQTSMALYKTKVTRFPLKPKYDIWKEIHNNSGEKKMAELVLLM